MENIEFAQVAVIVLGLCQIAKASGLNVKYIPALGLIVGILASWIVPETTIYMGIMGALSAMGLYSGTKTTFK